MTQDPFEELTKQVRAMRGDTPAPLPAPSVENPDTVRRLRDFLLYKASIARQNPSSFFEFVIKEETTRKPVKTAEHQKVVFDFVSNHDKSVIMMPVGHSKTYSVSSLSLFFLGQDPTLRGAIISETQGQAEKPLSMVRDYIESSQELRLVFPALGKSERKADPWTQTAITVARPTGIRDPSLVAVGYHGAIAGARLNWIITDDILGPENTRTKQARDDVYDWFDAAVLSRLDPRNARIVVTNTAWHPDDLVHRLERIGWPTLRMDITGGIQVSNTEWDSPLIRPSAPNSFDCRLSKYDNNTPLFPERFSNQDIERLKRTHLPHRFNQLYMSQCRNNEDSRCKLEWIDRCKAKGRGISLTSFYDGPNLTVTGVDLAVSDSSTSNDTVFFTFEVLPSGERLILDIDIGKYDGPTILDKMFQKHQSYKSYTRVENNSSQDFVRQFALQRNMSLPLRPHRTGREKAHPEMGVEGLFIEIYNGAWIIPNSLQGVCHPNVQRFIDACLYYSPTKHTDDVLMACYFAREEAKRFGIPTGSESNQLPEAGITGLFAR